MVSLRYLLSIGSLPLASPPLNVAFIAGVVHVGLDLLEHVGRLPRSGDSAFVGGFREARRDVGGDLEPVLPGDREDDVLKFLPTLAGQAMYGLSGPDRVGGTADDVDVDFGDSPFLPAEGFTGTQDTLGRIVFGVTS